MFYGADGQPWFRLDEQRHDVSLDEIAPDLQHAVVAVEDRRFYLHPGIDPIGLARAVVRDIRGGGRVEGGSTLTQQLARTLFLSNVRTFGRKIKEGGIALLHRGAALQEADSRVLSEPRLPERRRVRRRDDVGAPVPQAGERGHAAGGGVHRRPDSRAVRAVALVELRRRARAQPSRAVADARAGAHHRRRRTRPRATVRPRIQPYRQPNDARAGFAKEFLRQQFRNEFGGDNPPDWQVHTVVPAGGAGRRGAGGRRRDSSGCAARDSRRRSSRSIRRPATSWRWSAAPTTRAAPTTARCAAGGSRVRRSSRWSTRPRWPRATRRCRCCTNLRHVSAPGNPEWSPRSEGEQPDALTLRAALLESNNPAAADLQQRVGSRAVLRLAGDAGLSDLPDVPSLALGTGLVSPLDLTAAYTMFPGDGQVARPRGMISRVRLGRPPGVRPSGRSRAAHQPGGRVSDDQHAARRRSSAAPARRRARWASAARSPGRPGRPTTIATPGSSAIRRRSSSASGSASISRRRSAATRTARASRCRSGPTS